MPLTRFQRLQLTTTVRLEWYEAMARMSADGFSVADTLAEMQAEYIKIKHPMYPVVREVLLRLRGSGTGRKKSNGNSIRTLGTELNGLVPYNEALLIESGERAGDLANGLRRAAEYVRATNRLGSEVKAALIGPILLLVILLAILVFFSLNVLPTFAEISPRIRWPIWARRYGALADMSIPLTVGLIGGGGLLLAGYLQLAKVWISPTRDRLDMSLWPFTTTAQMNSAAMLASLSGFVNAGVPFSQAIDQLAQSSDPYMKDVYTRIGIELRKGKRPADALANSHIISKQYHWVIRMYGKSTEFDKALASLSTSFVEFAIARTKAIFTVFGFAIKLMIVGFVAWTMASMFGIVGSVKGGAVAELNTNIIHSTSVSTSLS